MGHGRYRLVRRIGVGGMAEVFEAVMRGEAGFERRVAIKRMRAGDADPAFARMFLDEARIVSRLSHANVVSVIDYGVLDDRPFQVFELVDGIDASALLARLDDLRRTLPVEVAIHICVELGHALQCAHEAIGTDGEPLGIVHRDVTPHNVLLSWAGDVKLGDFGIAFARDRSERTEAGIAKGKLAYMAPEQALGGRVDARTDVFALGCVLHALAAGASPLADPDTATGFLAGDPLPLAAELPDDLRAIIERATARARHERFSTAREMTDALGEALARRIDRDPRSLLAQLLGGFRDAALAAREDRLADEIELVAAPTANGAHGTALRSQLDGRDRPAAVRSRTVGRRVLVLGGAVALAAAAVWLWPDRDAERPADAASAPPAAPVPGVAASTTASAAFEPPASVVGSGDGGGALAPEPASADPGVATPVRNRPRRGSSTEPARGASGPRGYVKIVGGEINHARVIIDRVARGRAPTPPIELAAGTHQVVVELPDGGSIGPFTVDVDERSTAATPRVVRCTRAACR